MTHSAFLAGTIALHSHDSDVGRSCLAIYPSVVVHAPFGHSVGIDVDFPAWNALGFQSLDLSIRDKIVGGMPYVNIGAEMVTNRG